MKLINLGFSAIFFIIGVLAAVFLFWVIIAMSVLSFYSSDYIPLPPVTAVTMFALMMPAFFIGTLAFYSIEFSAYLFDKARKAHTLEAA